MRKLTPELAPLGRLYDPLLQLAQRVHRAVGVKRKTVWTDENGGVFVNDVDCIRTVVPRLIVGTYDSRTPVPVIEADLRLALRERASHWIVDWQAPMPDSARAQHSERTARLRSPPRRRRAAMKAAQLNILQLQNLLSQEA